MDFNFSNLANTSFTSTAAQRLKPYDIYKVKLTKLEKSELKGSKDPDKVYPVIAVEFTSVDENTPGVFSENIFIPTTQEDMTRRTLTNKEGHDSVMPSRFEEFQYTLMQIAEVLNPEGAKKIKENSTKIKTMEKFIDLIIKAASTPSAKNKVTNLKLVGRNNNGTIYASLPRACGLNRNGEIFATNFLGDNLYFSNYEITQQKKYRSAAPTPMNDSTPDDKDSANDFNLDDIADDIL